MNVLHPVLRGFQCTGEVQEVQEDVKALKCFAPSLLWLRSSATRVYGDGGEKMDDRTHVVSDEEFVAAVVDRANDLACVRLLRFFCEL